MRIVFVSAKVSVFQQDQTTITQEDPKGFTCTNINKNTKKYNHNSSIIVQHTQEQKAKAKINFIHWVASQRAL